MGTAPQCPLSQRHGARWGVQSFGVDDPHPTAVSAHQARQHLTLWLSATLTISDERRADS